MNRSPGLSPAGPQVVTATTLAGAASAASVKVGPSHWQMALLGLGVGLLCAGLIAGLLLFAHQRDERQQYNPPTADTILTTRLASSQAEQFVPQEQSRTEGSQPEGLPALVRYERYDPSLNPHPSVSQDLITALAAVELSHELELQALDDGHERHLHDQVAAQLSVGQKALYYWLLSNPDTTPGDCP